MLHFEGRAVIPTSQVIVWPANASRSNGGLPAAVAVFRCSVSASLSASSVLFPAFPDWRSLPSCRRIRNPCHSETLRYTPPALLNAANAPAQLADHYVRVRAQTLALAAPLSAEDLCVQSMPDASPGKWHLAHSTWFFETVVLQPHMGGYRVFDARFGYLFNSYYEALGTRHPRPERGLLTRPSLDEVIAYREHVDQAMQRFLSIGAEEDPDWRTAAQLVMLGSAPRAAASGAAADRCVASALVQPVAACLSRSGAANPAAGRAGARSAARFIDRPAGEVWIGHAADGFAFDNETPCHRVLLNAHAIADRLVSCGEFADFIDDGGYRRPELWLSDGWGAVRAQGWQAPAYWLAPDDPRSPADQWQVFGLHGVRALDRSAPVSQLSFYEAAAFAEWAGARLPTEFEWEAAFDAPGITQMTGHVWQWTRSSYDPYPGFQPMTGAVSEYNGKFMVGQIVLRGGSVATPADHARRSYRNFFPPAARWQFSGLRLARNA